MVFFVGDPSEDLERLSRSLVEDGVPSAVTTWLELPLGDARLCVLVTVPRTDAERSVLAGLARRRIPLFAAADAPAFRTADPHAVCPLPCPLEREPLARFVSWFPDARSARQVDDGEAAARNRRLVQELRLASELQRSILPRGTPSGAAVNLARKYVPYQYIGGDFYDFIPIRDGLLGLVIADASGHGIAAAFLTAMFKSAFGLFAQDGDSPAKTLSRLNTEFSRTLLTDHFMSAFYAILDTTSGELTYCSAGHPPQLLFRAGGEVVELTSSGFLLGSIAEAWYADQSLTMGQGDRLLLYTDGIVEAADSAGEQFGRNRIVDTVRRTFASPIEDISSELLSEAVMFLDQPTFQDDVTLIIAELAEEL